MALLTDELALPAYAGKKNARVTMTLFVDNGRGGPYYGFSILTTKPITRLTHTSKKYKHTIGNGHSLATEGTRNRIDVVALNKNQLIEENHISFDLVLDGSPLTDDDGTPWIFALRADGPHIFQDPGETYLGIVTPPNDYRNYRGIRADLHQGNETDVEAGIYPSTDRFLHSWAHDVDITLVDAPAKPVLSSRPSAQRAFFAD